MLQCNKLKAQCRLVLFENAITVAMAEGCSTNAIIHLVAISRRAGLPVTLRLEPRMEAPRWLSPGLTAGALVVAVIVLGDVPTGLILGLALLVLTARVNAHET